MKFLLSTLIIALTFLNCKAQDLSPFRIDSLWGYKDSQGVVKIEPQFQLATKFMRDIAVVAKNYKLGAIDKNAIVIIPFRYEFLQPLSNEEFLFGRNAKYFGEHFIGVMTKDERIKIPAEYSYISKTNATYTVVKQQDSIIGESSIGDIRSINLIHGLLDSNGKVLIPCEYGSLSWKNDSLIDVSKGRLGNHALFDNRGKQLTGFEYMVFGEFVEGLAKARIGNKYGFINPKGEVAIPVQFDYCEDFSYNYAMIRQDEKWGAINKEGKIIIKPQFDYEVVKKTLKEKYSR